MTQDDTTPDAAPPPAGSPQVSATGDEVASAAAPTTFARNVATELVATTLVVLAGPGSVVLSQGRIGALGFAISIGVAMAVAIGVIGAVANPAFTLAMLMSRMISVREAVGDWVGQVAGGVLGAALVFGIDDLTRFSDGANGWDRDVYPGLGSVLAAELVFGVVIVVVVLSATSRAMTTSAIGAFTGATYGLANLVLFHVDGGGLNPARSIGWAIFSDTDPSALGQLWAFVLVPLVAAVAAVFVWLAIDDAVVDDTVFDDTFVDDLGDRVAGRSG